MKQASAGMVSHLAQEVTTLTTCWELKRRDGRFFRFTDNVQDIVVDGNTYSADVGYVRSALTSSSGLAVDNMQVEGVFDNEAITEQDIRNGLFDFAEIRIFLINHQNTTDGIVRLPSGTLGEVQNIPSGQFVAELRGKAQQMAQIIGNLYQPTCRAQLGAPERCKFPINPPVVLRNTAYSVGEFVKAYTGNASAQILSVPVADGDFDALTGWTTVSGAPSIVSSQGDLTPFQGTGFLVAGGADFIISQTIDITAISGYNQTRVDSGFYTFQASIRQATSQISRDYGRVRIETLDTNGEVISEIWDTRFNRVMIANVWQLKSVDSIILPTGTRSLRIFVEAGAQSTTGSRAAFDDLQAEIVDNINISGAYEFYENRIYECTTAGATASSAPVFNTTINGTTTDGTVIWTARDAFTRSATVDTISSNRVFRLIITTSTAGSVDDYFNGGELIFETGNNVLFPIEVRDWSQSNLTITTFLPLPNSIQVGDKLRVIPGCARTRADCRDKFRIPGSLNLANGNINEYDGEPDIPGPDSILTYPDATS